MDNARPFIVREMVREHTQLLWHKSEAVGQVESADRRGQLFAYLNDEDDGECGSAQP